MPPIFRHRFTVGPDAIDENGHVNNVVYVQWMQDVAVRHSNAAGCTRLTRKIGAMWVARSHQIEYLSPAFAGDEIEAQTWVANFRKIRSLRRYRFVRTGDQRLLAKGETDWVFVDVQTNRPRSIPPEVSGAFDLLAGDPPPS
ncbi:MAG: acyl-CoA thioesterase [Planctomycetota bacterium]|jgi:acyl-CoA thioester hydrolase